MFIFSLFFHPKIKSSIHGPITFLTIKGHKALRAGGVTHSGGEIWPMWQNVMSQVQRSKLKVRNCLILGVGGGDLIKLVHDQYPEAHITGIEIDSVMVEVAKKYFDVSIHRNTDIEITDAIRWVKNNYKDRLRKFDLVFNDLYIGPLNPKKSRSKEYVNQLKSLLSPSGILVYNAHYQEKSLGEFEEFMKICKSLFSNVEIVFKYPLNRVMMIRK